jgi:hypothetical protein
VKAAAVFFSPEPMKRGEIVLPQLCQGSPHDATFRPREAGQFNMITAKVRCGVLKAVPWEGSDGFRVGGQRMLPLLLKVS